MTFVYSTLGQGLATSTYPGEVIFSISLAIFGLILFALLIGNMQVNLQITVDAYNIHLAPLCIILCLMETLEAFGGDSFWYTIQDCGNPDFGQA